MKTLQELANEALQIQDACNLSGVVHSFHRVISEVWENARAQGKGTDWVNRHPIVRAYVSKLVMLSRYEIGDDTFSEVMAIAEDFAEKK